MNDPHLQGLKNPMYVPGMSSYNTAPGTGLLIFHVFAEKSGSRLNGPARLDVTNLANHIGLFQTIEGDGEAVFVDLAFGDYEVEVSALGYLSARQHVQVVSTIHPEPIDVVLHRDPSAVRLEVAVGTMPPKARREAKSALSLLKLGLLPEAQKELEKAYKLAPENADLNFLLGYLYFQKRDYLRAGTFLGTAANLSPHNAQALTLLGRADLAQENYSAARSALEQAVLADADNWLPHNLLADTYLREKKYSSARDEAQVAITKGQRDGATAASPAEVVLGQALLGLGREQEAIQAFNLFLTQSPQNPLVYQVRALVAELKKHDSTSAPAGQSGNANAVTARADPLAAVPDPELSTQAWRPFDIDDVKPTLAPGIACPTTSVLEESGKRVQAFAQDLARFAADENLFHQSIDAFGFATHTETRKYDYVAMVSEPQPGGVSIDEYRTDKLNQEGNPDGIQSTGFITLALVFHPDMQRDFEFDCEGQGDWRGQASWVVHFRQRQDHPNRMHSYTVGGQVFPVALKGRAWISADQFQIVRMEADMVNPVQPIQLLSEHQVVEYGPVPFAKKNTTLWLPRSAEIYISFRKHHYYRRHSFDRYMLFSVDTDEKRKEPVAPPEKPAASG
jgi:tetratricopeptide (TPR) repeat protein